MSLFISPKVPDFIVIIFPSTPGNHILLNKATSYIACVTSFLDHFLSSAEAPFPIMPCNKKVLLNAPSIYSGLRFPEDWAELQEQRESGEVDDFYMLLKYLGAPALNILICHCFHLELQVPETCKHQVLKVSIWGVEIKGLFWNVFSLPLDSPSSKMWIVLLMHFFGKYIDLSFPY